MSATIVNIQDKFTADLYVVLSTSFTNSTVTQFGIYCDNEDDAIQLYFDYAVEYDTTINRETHINLTLTGDEITEYTKDGCIDDYLSMDGINYLSDVLMRGCLDTCQNCFKSDFDFQLPVHFITYLFNADCSALNDDEIKQFDEYYKEWELNKYSHEIEGEQYFCSNPDICPLACDVVDLHCIEIKGAK